MGSTPPPPRLTLLKKCKIGTVGHPLQMIMQQKWDQLRTYAPVKNLFDNMDVLSSNLIHKRPSSLKNSELQACQFDTSMGQCEARV